MYDNNGPVDAPLLTLFSKTENDDSERKPGAVRRSRSLLCLCGSMTDI